MNAGFRLYRRPRSPYWWAEVKTDGRPNQRVSTRKTDRSAAQLEAAKLLRQEEMAALGLPVHAEDRKAKLTELVEEYRSELRRRGNSAAHVDTTGRRLDTLLEPHQTLVDLTPAAVRHALDKVEAKRGLSAATVNAYRTALFGLFRWLMREGRWSTNPVQAVQRKKVLPPLRRRRALTLEELQRLLAVVPPYRSLVYRCAATTGLRRSELQALRWRDIDLEAATVTVRAATAKNRRDAILPLPLGTVAALRPHQGTPGTPVFRRIPYHDTYKADFAAAGIAADETERIDLHSLRVTFCTMLALAGVPLVVAQELMRHSDPKLTANIYTRLRLHDKREAVARIDLPPHIQLKEQA